MKIKLLSQNCFLASHPLVLPYFVRSTLIKHQVHSDLFSQELLVASKAPLSEFARRVNERALPGEFYSVEAAGLAGVKCLMEVKDFTGEFMDTRCLHDLSQDTTWFKHATLYSLPLSRQPNSPYPACPWKWGEGCLCRGSVFIGLPECRGPYGLWFPCVHRNIAGVSGRGNCKM